MQGALRFPHLANCHRVFVCMSEQFRTGKNYVKTIRGYMQAAGIAAGA
jgi:hypothetical protein